MNRSRSVLDSSVGQKAAKRSVAPLYVQICETIAKRIATGRLKVGDRLHSERRIAAQFKVSLMTARHALQTLEREGMVDRRHGAGTFVRTPKINWNELMSFTEQMGTRGAEPRSILLSATVEQAEDDVAKQLEIAPQNLVFRIERLRSGGEEPLALEICYLAFKGFPGLLRFNWERSSLYRVLETEYHMRLSYAEESIEAQVADKRLANLFHVRAGEPVLHVHQRLVDSENRPICISASWYRADRHSFKIVRVRPALTAR